MKIILSIIVLISTISICLGMTELSEAIGRMYDQWLTSFDSSISFMSSNWLRRDEAAKFFVNYAKNILHKKISNQNDCSFGDINQAWPDLKEVLVESCQLGLFKWFNGNFIPRQMLTNAQAITVFIRMIDWMKKETGSYFATEYFKEANDLSLLENIDLGNESSLESVVTRWDVAIMLFRGRLLVWKDTTTNPISNNITSSQTLTVTNTWNKIDEELKKWFSIIWDQNFTTEKRYLTKWTYYLIENFGYNDAFVVSIIPDWEYDGKKILEEHSAEARKTYFYINKDGYLFVILPNIVFLDKSLLTL